MYDEAAFTEELIEHKVRIRTENSRKLYEPVKFTLICYINICSLS